MQCACFTCKCGCYTTYILNCLLFYIVDRILIMPHNCVCVCVHGKRRCDGKFLFSVVQHESNMSSGVLYDSPNCSLTHTHTHTHTKSPLNSLCIISWR